MKMSEFIALVRQMRAKQDEFFKTRRNDVLLEAKALERKVDQTIREDEQGQQKLPL